MAFFEETKQTLCFFNRINRRAIRNHLVKVERLDHCRDALSRQVSMQRIPMKNLFVRFVKDDSAATAIEYGLIAAGISVAIIAVVSGIGTNLNGKFNTVSTQLK
jgi:pilus assembly protein Flp/PilA